MYIYLCIQFFPWSSISLCNPGASLLLFPCFSSLFPSFSPLSFLLYTCCPPNTHTRDMVKSNIVLVIRVWWRSLLESGRKKSSALINHLQCVGPSSQGTELSVINCQKYWVKAVNDRAVTAWSVSVSLEAGWLDWGVFLSFSLILSSLLLYLLILSAHNHCPSLYCLAIGH